jgi:hypothetical protein
MPTQRPIPVRLRPTAGEAIGTTAFFRNRILNDTLLNELKAAGKSHYAILFHACSIGAEVYSFIIQYLERGMDQHFSLSCQAVDKQQGFVDFARNAEFPQEVLQGCSDGEQQFFSGIGDKVTLVEKVKNLVQFLPACDFKDFSSDKQFDVVFLLNALVYVPMEVQSTVLDRVSSYNSGWLVTSGFHQQSIKQDLQRNDYSPIETAIQEIHMSWVDRLRTEPVLKESLPANIYTDWSLQPFSKVEDYEYRYCALFKKQAAVRS